MKIVPLSNLTKQILTSKITKKRIPILVSFHVTNDCTMRCRYCYANVDNRFDEKKKDLSLEETQKLIDEMHKAGTRYLILLGGEPLMRKDIGEIISYIRKKNMLCEVVTNGTLIKSKIDEIKDVDLLCISLDGDEEANDAVRGKGTYRRIVEGLKIASDNKIKTRLHAVLTKTNSNERCLQHLDGLAKGYNTTFGYSSPIIHDYNKIDELFLPEEEEREFWKLVRQYKKKGARIYNSLDSINYLIKWPLRPSEIVANSKDMQKLSNFKPKPCFAGKRYCYIDNEGYVYACICMGVKSGLNVKDVGFTKAFEHLGNFNCGACAYIQYTEGNSVIDLQPHSIMLGLKTFFGL